jgi:hypothetical protein
MLACRLVPDSPESLPIVISVPNRGTLEQTNDLIQAFNRAEKQAGPVELDCGPVTLFGPFGIALLGALIAIRRRSGRQTRLLPPRDEEVARFVREVGLDRFAQGEQTGVGTLEIREMHALDPTYTRHVTDMLVRGVQGVTEENSYPIELCLNELLQNVFEWSESTIGCTVLTRWYHKTRSVRLTVVDLGIGIPAALRRRLRELQRESDAAVIEAAVTQPRLTSRENKRGGIGLKLIREVVCDELAGSLTVRSHTAKLVWHGKKARRRRISGFRGTAIEIDFRPSQPVENPNEHVAVF